MRRQTSKKHRFFGTLCIILCMLLLFGSFPLSMIASAAETEQMYAAVEMLSSDHATGELLVATTEDTATEDAFAILKEIAGTEGTVELIFSVRDSKPATSEIFLLTVSAGEEQTVLRELLSCESVSIAEPNYAVTIEDPVSVEETVSAIETLTDSMLGTSSSDSYDPIEQWELDKIGVADAWASGFTGSAEIRVGVIDSGYSAHSDLDAHVDLSLAYNAGDKTSDVSATSSHGNMVAGIIGAELNGVGTVGVCQNITIVPIKYRPSYISGKIDYISSIIRAINYANGEGILLLNLSLKLYDVEDISNTFMQAVALYNGLIITTAGNNSLDMASGNTTTLACNALSNMIVVGSTNSLDQMSDFSNYSATYCDLFAPGEDIDSTSLSDGYASADGTSFAAPYVTAAAALIMSHATHLTPLEVKTLLLDTVDVLDSLDGKCVTEGRLSIINAINYLYTTENRGVYSLGDLTGDGYVTSEDYTIAKQIVLHTYTPSAAQTVAADVNHDGKVNATDYIMINKFVQKTYYFPPEV